MEYKNIEQPVQINEISDLLFLLNNNLLEIRFHLSEHLLKENIIPSISYIFNSILYSIID
jgi:hypothetical protein